MKFCYTYRYLLILAVFNFQACNPDDEINLDSEFVQFYRQGTAVDMLKAGDGGFLLAAQDSDRGTPLNNTLLMKVDHAGDLEWERKIDDFRVKDLLLSSLANEEYILLGDSDNADPNDLVIMHYDKSGNKTKEFKPDLGVIGQNRSTGALHAIQMTYDPSDGSTLITGGSDDINGLIKPFIFKLNQDQSIPWIYELGNEDPDANVVLNQSLVVADGRIILAFNIDPQGNSDSFIRMSSLNSSTGQEFSLNTITDRGDMVVNDIIETSFGFALTGAGPSFFSPQELRLIFLDKDAQVMENLFGNPLGFSEGNTLSPTADGGFVVAGSIRAFNNNDFVMLKMDQSGAPVWDDERVLGGETGDDISKKVLEVEDGDGYILFGTSEIFSAISRITLIKTNRDGLLYE